MSIECVGNYQTLSASGGLQALMLHERYHPDLILTDLGMPGMSGLELIRRVRAVDQRTPLLVITGWGDTLGVPDGANALMMKPVGLWDLAAAIENLLAGSPASGEAGSLRGPLAESGWP